MGGGGGGGGVGWWGLGWVGKLKAGFPCHQGTDSCAALSVGDRDVNNPQDNSRQALAAVYSTTILISAPQWLHSACNIPTQFNQAFIQEMTQGGQNKVL